MGCEAEEKKLSIGKHFSLLNNLKRQVYNKVTINNKGLNPVANSPDEISHYCTLYTLKNIIESRRLRFSSVKYLNDETEYIHLIDVFRYTVEKLRSQIDKRLYSCITEKEFIADLKNYSQTYKINAQDFIRSYPKECNVYTCSFSTSNDSLALFRAYGSEQTGCAINFELNDDLISTAPDTSVFSGNVLYSNQEKADILSFLIKEINKIWINYTCDTAKSNENGINYETNILSDLKDLLNMLRVFFKDESFKSEEEFRIVFVISRDFARNSNYDFGFFRRGTLMIPYFDIYYNSQNLKSINLGPYMKGVEKDSLGEVLCHYGFNSVDIVSSAIPLRAY